MLFSRRVPRAAALFGLLCLVVSVFLFVTLLVPYHNDEFIHYHILRCLFYPASAIGDGQCNAYALRFPFAHVALPLRVYHYVGSLPALFALPLLTLVREPVVVRMIGPLLLLCSAAILSRIHKVSFVGLAALLFLVFPLAYQHIIDTGPISYPFFFLTLLFALAWSAHERPRAWKAWFFAVIVFAGIWSKLTFLWYLPAIAVLAGYALGNDRRRMTGRFLLSHCAGPLLLLMLLLLFLFRATAFQDARLFPYWDQLRSAESYSLDDILSGAWRQSGILQAMQNPLQAAEKSFLIPPPRFRDTGYHLLLVLLPPLLLYEFSWVRKREARTHFRFALASYGLFLLTLGAIFVSKHAYAMHHLLLSAPFLLSAYLFLYQGLRALALGEKGPTMALRKGVAAFAVFLAVSFGSFLWTLRALPLQGYDHPSKMAINTLLRDDALAEEYYYVSIDWGMMFYQGLFGSRKQAVVWRGDASEATVAPLRSLAAERGRKLLFLHMQGNPWIPALRSRLSTITCCLEESCTGWNVTAEPNPRLKALFPFCF